MSLLFRAYHRAPVVLQNAAVTALGMDARYRRFGAEFRRALPEMLRGQWRGAAAWEALQRGRLAALLAQARRDVPFYADYPVPDPDAPLRDLLDALPLLDKAVVRGAPEAFHHRRLGRMRPLAFRTSGTQGAPMRIFQTVGSHALLWAGMERFWRASGVRGGDRRVSFTGNPVVRQGRGTGPFGRHDRANARLMMSVYHLGERTADAYLDEIARFRPAFMDGYPSAMATLARRLVETGRTLPLVACFPTAETLLPEDRALIEAGFATRVYNQYGSAEGAALVTECPAGSLHVNPEVGVVEVLAADGRPAAPGETGELVVTTLNNLAMPLVRYRIGDLARAGGGEAPCACGRAMPRLRDLAGRQDDVVATRDGRRIGMLSFNVFKWTTGIAGSQIVQESLDHFVLRIVPGPRFSPEQGEVAVRALRDRVGQHVRVDVELCEGIPRGPNGKFRAVVSRVPAGAAPEARG